MRLLQVLAAGATISQAASTGSPDDLLFGSTLGQDNNLLENGFMKSREDAKLVVSAVQVKVSWSQVMQWDPEGLRMRPSADGVAVYQSLLSELVANGARPVVALFDEDLPPELSTELDPPGWLNADIASRFGDFAKLAFEEFGSKVKYWAPFGKIQSSIMSYPVSTRNEAARNMLLAHGRSVALFRQLQAERSSVPDDARIGIGLSWDVVGGAARPDWFLEPLFTGHVADHQLEQTGRQAREFMSDEATLVKGSYDVFVFCHEHRLSEYREVLDWVHRRDQHAEFILIDKSRGVEANSTIVLQSILKETLWSLSVMLGVVLAGAGATIAVAHSLRIEIRRCTPPHERTPLTV